MTNRLVYNHQRKDMPTVGNSQQQNGQKQECAVSINKTSIDVVYFNVNDDNYQC